MIETTRELLYDTALTGRGFREKRSFLERGLVAGACGSTYTTYLNLNGDYPGRWEWFKFQSELNEVEGFGLDLLKVSKSMALLMSRLDVERTAMFEFDLGTFKADFVRSTPNAFEMATICDYGGHQHPHFELVLDSRH